MRGLFMKFFDFLKKFFQKKEEELTIEAQKWNKMWDLWVEEEADSPYAELMTYQSEVNNGGHMQFFDNVSNTDDLSKNMEVLYSILKGTLRENIEKAYNAFLAYDENDENDTISEIMDECDDVFYANENEIERILQEYADTIALD
jgi:hypothetical protein